MKSIPAPMTLLMLAIFSVMVGVAATYPPGARFMPYVVLAFFAVVLVLLTQEEDTLQALLVTPVWFVILVGSWFAVRNRVHHDSSTTELVD